MSILALPRSSITFDIAPGSSITARCSYVQSRIPISEEVPSLIVKLDQYYTSTLESYGNTIQIGDTVHVWLDRWDGVGSQYNVFNGLVNRLAKDIEGHVPRWYEIEAVGFADHLNRVYVGYTFITDTVSNVISQLVAPAVASGLITIGEIDDTIKGTYTFDHISDQMSVFNALNEVAGDKMWEWYVDNRSRFYAHPVGQNITPITFASNILSAEYEEDGRNIINSQRVLGPDGRSIGSDVEYTEDLDGWTSSADAITLLAAASPLYLDLWFTKIKLKESSVGPSFKSEGPLDGGDFSLQFNWLNSVDSPNLWIRKTLEDRIDLSYFGWLNFDMRWVYYGTNDMTPDLTLRFKVRYEVDASNYFEYKYDTSDIKVARGPGPPGNLVDSGWQAVALPFNIKTGAYDLIRVGNPSYSEIISIYLEVTNPKPLGTVFTKANADLFIDNMWFNHGHFYAFRYDQTSIDIYGERRGGLIYDENLSSDSECGEIADSIINYYKNPIKRFNSILLDDIPYEIPLGYISTITVAEVVQASAIRAVTYTLEDMQLQVKLELSDVYIPKISQIISDIKRYVEQDEADSLPEDTNPSIVSNLLNSPLGADDVNLSKNQDNLINNPRFEINSNGDNIPDSWYPMGRNYPIDSDITIPYRSEDEVNSGQWAGLVSAQVIAGATWYSRTLGSEMFPWDPYSTHYASVWAKSSHDVTHTGTFGIQMVMFGDSPDLIPLKTISVVNDEYTKVWKLYDHVFETVEYPVGAKWGRLDLIGIKGSANFFDDCIVQRFFGVDGGQHSLIRPLQYTSSSESEVLVYSKTWDPGVMPIKYICTGIQGDLRVDTGDGGNFSGLTVKTIYNGVVRNEMRVSSTETDWETMHLDNDVDVGNYANTLVAEFYLVCGNSAHVAFLRNAEIQVSSYSVKTQMRGRYQIQKE